MSSAVAVWGGAAVLMVLVWAVRAVALWRMSGKRCVVGSHSYDGPPSPAPFVSVVVAAKDEERNIEDCLASLLAQDYPSWELIVVNDRSSDATPDILRRLAAGSAGRLRVLHVDRLSDGWFGKNNAMREGVAASRGDWLLFTDADCRFHARNAFSMAMREAVAYESDFLSITPNLETPTWWERIIQPVCAMVLMVRFLPHRVNKPNLKTAYANGAFMLMSRGAYVRIGGHERVRTEVNEDIRMAQFAKQAGLSLRVVENDDLYSTRMYDTPAAAFRGWSRIFYGSLPGVLPLASSALELATLSIGPWLGLMLSVFERVRAASSPSHAWIWAAAAWSAAVIVEQGVIAFGFRRLRVPVRWSLTYPIGCLVTVAMLVSAIGKALGLSRTVWRNTTYRLSEHVDAPKVGIAPATPIDRSVTGDIASTPAGR